MSILFLVGSKKEDLSVISDLLDVTKSPNKPQYLMADPEPLVLYDCIFNPGETAKDSRSKRYYNIIRSHPLFQPIVDSNAKSKYNCDPCCFDNSLSPTALRDLIGYGESQLYDCEVTMARYKQMLDGIYADYEERVKDLPEKKSDFRELLSLNYTPLKRRSKARME